MISTKDNNSNSASQNKPQTYRVIRLIGEGAYGKAYLVECTADNSLCVIKTINIDNISDQEKKETLMEAKILEKLDHPNIIRFRETFLAKKPRFSLNIVTDYAEGGDLHGKIKSRKGKLFNETQILDWFTQICLALKHLHDKKILHRDLKSQNIFLTENGMIKLGDFGIAKCLECTWQKVMTVVGTPYYLSPEIVNNKPYSFKSDIWSLGVLLYEMSSLKMPFDATSLPMLSLKIIKGMYNPLPLTYSKDLKNLVAMLLVVDPNKRPNINDILKLPIIKARIKSFLNEFEYNQEFSHTIIHNFNVLKDKVNKTPPSNMLQKNNSSSNVDTSQNSIQSNNSNQSSSQDVVPKKVVANNNPNAVIQANNKNITPNSNLNYNQNVVINANPPKQPVVDSKKREADNKEIADFLKKNEKKKATPVTKEVKKGPNKNDSNNEPDNQINPNVNVNKNKNVISNEEINTLKELMKKGRAELKNQPKDDVIWLGKEKELVNNFNNLGNNANNPQKKKQNNFPNVIILDKPKSTQSNKEIIDTTPTTNDEINFKSPIIAYNKLKEQEELYNLNRYLNEIAKIDNNEQEQSDNEVNETVDSNNINSNNDDQLNDARDFNFIEESSTPLSKESSKIDSLSDKTDEEKYLTENSKIEELRIELENSLGFDLFKRVYKTVEENTDPYLFKCDFEQMKELIIQDLSGKCDKKKIDSAIDKIPDVFVIVVKERVSNFK